METKEQDVFRSGREGAVIVALDERKDGLLFGAVELRNGEELWLDYELELSPEGGAVSLFRGAEDVPVLEYHASGRRLDTVSPPDRMLIFWNHGRRALAADGEPLAPGEIAAFAPQGATPWLLRFAGWLSKRE